MFVEDIFPFKCLTIDLTPLFPVLDINSYDYFPTSSTPFSPSASIDVVDPVVFFSTSLDSEAPRVVVNF